MQYLEPKNKALSPLKQKCSLMEVFFEVRESDEDTGQ